MTCTSETPGMSSTMTVETIDDSSVSLAPAIDWSVGVCFPLADPDFHHPILLDQLPNRDPLVYESGYEP